MVVLIAVLVIWNLIVFLLYGIDKRKSKKHKWRISERALLICAACFGGAGALAGMKAFHHKTLHKKFSIGVPLMLAAQIVIIILFCKHLF